MQQSKITTVDHWARSRGGLPISLHRSFKSTTLANRPLLIIGGVHGDEPEGVWLAEHLLEWLKTLKTELPWLLITCINPDGYSKNQRTNSAGVDLNRNFPAKNWSPVAKSERYYPGPSANSEPEVQALVKLIEVEKPQLILHLHSWEPCVVYTGDPGKRDSDRLAKSSGYESRPDIGYPTPGSLGEYGWKECGIPVICVEEQEGEKKQNVWPHFKEGFKEIFLDTTSRIP